MKAALMGAILLLAACGQAAEGRWIAPSGWTRKQGREVEDFCLNRAEQWVKAESAGTVREREVFAECLRGFGYRWRES